MPRFGKDHLTLAEWRTSAPRFQQPKTDVGSKPTSLKFELQRADGSIQRIRIGRDAEGEFPAGHDEDLVPALLTLGSMENPRYPKIVRFILKDILLILRRPLTDANYKWVTRAVKRYVQMNATLTDIWYSRKQKQVAPDLWTRIIAQAQAEGKRGVRSRDCRQTAHVEWTDHFHQSQLDGELIELDLDLLARFKTTAQRKQFRILNKVWHAGKKPSVHARDLKEVCSQLGMVYSGDFKKYYYRNVIIPLEQAEYLVATPEADRFIKVKPGIYRVTFELHPQHHRTQKATKKSHGPATQTNSAATTPAHRLVMHYHQLRFKSDNHVPIKKELTKAELLLESHSLEDCLAVTPAVARRVKRLNQDDLYFSYAVPHYEKELATRSSRRTAEHSDSTEATTSETDTVDRAKLERRSRYRKLSTEAKRELFEAVAAATKSDFLLRELQQMNLDKPPSAVLQEMEVAQSIRGGDLGH